MSLQVAAMSFSDDEHDVGRPIEEYLMEVNPDC